MAVERKARVMTEQRTKAERNADRLSREVDRLKQRRDLSGPELQRLRVAEYELERAWRVVLDMRNGRR